MSASLSVSMLKFADGTEVERGQRTSSINKGILETLICLCEKEKKKRGSPGRGRGKKINWCGLCQQIGLDGVTARRIRNLLKSSRGPVCQEVYPVYEFIAEYDITASSVFTCASALQSGHERQ